MLSWVVGLVKCDTSISALLRGTQLCHRQIAPELEGLIKGINTFPDLSALKQSPLWVGKLAGSLECVKTNQIPHTQFVTANQGAPKPAGGLLGSPPPASQLCLK